jgi:hypothetical protein
MENSMSEEQTTEQAQPEAAPAPSLSLQDLIQVVRLIQLTAQRGAIQATEMATVGALHDRLVTFLEANGAVQRNPAPTAEAETETAPADQGE